jgi:alkylhydroperoxidase family enzyme
LAFGIAVGEIAESFSDRMEHHLKLPAQCAVASIVGCEFCLDIGAALAQHSDISERNLREFDDFETSDAFDDDRRRTRFYLSLVIRPGCFARDGACRIRPAVAPRQ